MWLPVPERAAAEVQLIWRVDLSDALLATAMCHDDARDGLITQLAACRRTTIEPVSEPLYAARAWLEHASPPVVDDVASLLPGKPVRTREASGQPALRSAGEDSSAVFAGNLRPGDILVIPATRGGLRGTAGPQRPLPLQAYL